MNCPVCDKVLNPNLSICTSCGAMRDDDVREEIMGSVIHVRKPLTIELEEIADKAEVPETSSDDEAVFNSDEWEGEELVIDISETPELIAAGEAETQNLSLELIEEESHSMPLFENVSETKEEVPSTSTEPETQVEIERIETVEVIPVVEEIEEPVVGEQPKDAPVARVTAPIIGRDTGKIVIEFQNKKSEEPEWKSNLRNRLRGNGASSDAVSNESTVEILKTGTTDAVASSQTGTDEIRGESGQTPVSSSAAPNLIKERALRRIEESRRRFGSGGGSTTTGVGLTGVETASDETPEKILVVEKTDQEPTERKSTGEITPPGKPRVKIRLVPNPHSNHNTNKLDSGELDSKVEAPPQNESETESKRPRVPSIRIVESELTEALAGKDVNTQIPLDDDADDEPLQPGLPILEDMDEEDEEEFEYEEEEEYEEEIGDLAPLGQRFNAGLFDMLICAFAALLILAPYIAMGGDILSSTGLLLFFVSCSLTTIVYQTLSVGLKGKTFGMRLFALEVIDIEENEYPTMAQAFGSSLLFVLSLSLGGLGFIPILFSPERRAIHDLASGTLMVREY